jgi:hypothetical protein
VWNFTTHLWETEQESQIICGWPTTEPQLLQTIAGQGRRSRKDNSVVKYISGILHHLQRCVRLLGTKTLEFSLVKDNCKLLMYFERIITDKVDY